VGWQFSWGSNGLSVVTGQLWLDICFQAIVVGSCGRVVVAGQLWLDSCGWAVVAGQLWLGSKSFYRTGSGPYALKHKNS
jgi:hypothetical protein